MENTCRKRRVGPSFSFIFLSWSLYLIVTMSIPGLGWVSKFSKPVFQQSPKTLAIPMDLHQSARQKVVSLLHSRGVSNGLALFQGGSQETQYDSDTEFPFRQDSWFNYLFGVKEPEFYAILSLSSGKTTLFMPKLPVEYLVWCGEIYPPEHFKKMYGVDDVQYTDTLPEFVRRELEAEGENAKLHLMEGKNSDSKKDCNTAKFDGIEEFESKVEKGFLFHAVSTARVTKSPSEIEAMRYSAYVASNAHVEVMRTVSAGMFEYELEAKFLYEIYRNGGCRKAAYTSICGCGPNAATLHYGHAGAPNLRMLQPTDIALFDMGADYHGYVSDITCSFPVSGKFTEDQALIFNAVLSAQRAVMALARPGISWVDCHKAAERAILVALIQGGLLHGDVDEMVEAVLGATFFPHGLGHLIGCDTHDVGGYLMDTPERETRSGLKSLRTARVLESNMVLTNEPGCYFVDYLLDLAISNPAQSKFINVDVLNRFRGFGGVRLEDVIVITETGVENLTTCPRTIEEIENIFAGGVWPPTSDTAPELRRSWTRLGPDGEGMIPLTLG